jgi:mannose-6-phosphate isomerase-like protein (cupin superfamily)
MMIHYVVFPEEDPPDWAYPRSGFAFETPTGEKFRVMRSSVETGGEYAQSYFVLVPGGHAARAHIHPHQEESFHVLSGSLTVVVNGEEKVVSAGQTLVVPPGTPHQPFNRGNVEMHSMGQMRPGGKLGLFFGQMAGLDFKPGFLQMTLFSQQYGIYPASPSPTITRALSFLLAPTARLVGYQSFYPEYAKRFLRRAAQQGADGPRDSAALESSGQPPASGPSSNLPFNKLPTRVTPLH